MPTQVLTTDDLREFKQELFEQLEALINKAQPLQKQWLKTKEVLQLLKISPNTLNMLRAKGKLPFTKLAGTIYYSYDDIVAMMEQDRIGE